MEEAFRTSAAAAKDEFVDREMISPTRRVFHEGEGIREGLTTKLVPRGQVRSRAASRYSERVVRSCS